MKSFQEGENCPHCRVFSTYISLVVSNSNMCCLLQSSLSRLAQSSKGQITGLFAGIPATLFLFWGLLC